MHQRNSSGRNWKERKTLDVLFAQIYFLEIIFYLISFAQICFLKIIFLSHVGALLSLEAVVKRFPEKIIYQSFISHRAFLRRHYLSRAESPLQRMSRNFEERKKSRNDRQKSSATSAALKKHHPPVFCKMVPEQKCEKKRVNPRRVEKEMKKTFCREPRKNSIFDQLLMAKLTHPEFSEFNP